MAGPDNISGNSRQVASGIRDVNAAFMELSQTGKLTNQTLEAISLSLVRINPLLGALAAAGTLAVESFRLLDNLDIKDNLNSFADTAKDLGLQFEIMRARAEAGHTATDQMSSAYKNAADILNQLADVQADVSDRTNKLNENAKDSAEITAQISNETGKWNKAISDHQKMIADGKEKDADARAALEKQIEVLGNNIRTLEARKAELDDQRVSLQDAASAEENETRAAAQLNTAYEILLLTQQKLNAQQTIATGLLDKSINPIQVQIDKLGQEINQRQALLNMRIADGTETAVQLQQDEEEIASLNAKKAALQGDLAEEQRLANFLDSIATPAYDAYCEAIDKTISLHNLLSEATGRAMQNVASNVLKSLGQQAIGKAMMATADGIVDLATPGMQGFAAGQFEAAGLYLALAALAGVGAGALSVSPGSRGGGGGGGGGMSSGGGDTINQYVTVIGTLDDRDAANLQQQLARARQKGDLDS